MPAGQVQAAITQMRDAASSIATSHNLIDEAMTKVDAEIKALGTDVFMSDAADAFRTNYYSLTPKLIEAQRGLNTFMQKLRDSAAEIERAGSAG
jgi:uncharacterized protein YukE